MTTLDSSTNSSSEKSCKSLSEPIRTMDDISKFITQMKFKKKVFGGVDPLDVLRQMDILQGLYRQVYECKVAYDKAILDEKDGVIQSLNEVITRIDSQKNETDPGGEDEAKKEDPALDERLSEDLLLELNKKDEELKASKQEILQKDQELKRKDEELKEKDRLLEQKDQQLKEKDEQLKAHSLTSPSQMEKPA